MQVPEGFMMNAQGGMDPKSAIKEHRLMEDDLARRLTESAKSVRDVMAQFKGVAMGEAQAFRDLLRDQYGVTKGGERGNMTLRSYDGTCEVEVQIADSIAFGPELDAAKKLVHECIEDWAEGANDNLRVVVMNAFQVKKGKIDTARVLALRGYDIKDPKWLRAMDAISDAVRVTSSKTYIRFYEHDATGQRDPIVLNLAAL